MTCQYYARCGPQAVFDLERETEEGRERAAADRERRREREDQKRATLKAAMLKQMAARIQKAKKAAPG